MPISDNNQNYDQILADLQQSLADPNLTQYGRESVKRTIALIKKKKAEQDRAKKAIEKQIEQEIALEENHILEVTSMDLPMDWENAFANDERVKDVHVDSIADGLVKSLNELGMVDIEYISAITGAEYKTIIETLRGSIYQNPTTWDECFYKGWETASEYLSGNIFRKLIEARKANKKYCGYFKANIKALSKLLPQPIATEDIYITIGSPWIPTEIIDEFIIHLFGEPTRYCNNATIETFKKYYLPKLKVKHDELIGAWEIPEKNRYFHSVAVTKTFGTKDLEGLHILERMLNKQQIVVYTTAYSFNSKTGEKRVIDNIGTIAAVEKQKLIQEEFDKWIWADEERKYKLINVYEEKYGCIRRRIFDGSFLEFPNMSRDVTLFKYQKDAVARILFSPNTLLAHDVGAGKTYVMIAASQELKRMKLSDKNLFVVPNNIVGQWKDMFVMMYPNVNLLVVEPKNFIPAKRQKILEAIRDKDYDGIIMAYSCFEQIPLSKKAYADELQADLDRAMGTYNGKKSTKKLQRKITVNQEAIKKLQEEIIEEQLSSNIFFDELGINRLFVDEAHNFKNVPLKTKSRLVLGLNTSGSERCQDMMDKVHMIQRQNKGGGVVFATGTPITNSVTDVYIIQQYLQQAELEFLGIQSFDSWIGMFAEETTGFEIDVDTSGFRLATRFSKFHNIPELTTILSSIADFHQLDETAGIPHFEGYIDTLVPKSKNLADYLKKISERADFVRAGKADRKIDNMLKITTDGRKAALDVRLVDDTASFDPNSKVAKCVENVVDLYKLTESNKATQIIFCDSSAPKQGFNVYDELKQRLMLAGIPSEEIAFVHYAETESQKKKLYTMMNKGEIRVLIGSTFKLGLGVNVQERLIAVHHIDVPWRPADMVQREGRILRQGNTNEQVYIYRYITEGSFDAYSWQLLETKQRFISELLAGTFNERAESDVSDTVLNYAEVKALAIGNPKIKKRVELSNELNRYVSLQNSAETTRQSLEQETLDINIKIGELITRIDLCKKDIAFYDNWKKDNPFYYEQMKEKEGQEQRKDLREFIGDALRNNVDKQKDKKLITYRGFDIILPANMIIEKPFVWLVKNGKYYVEMGEADVGKLIRLDNFIEGLDKFLERLTNVLAEKKQRLEDINKELLKNEDYANKIQELKIEIAKIDKEIGVKNE